MSFKMLHTLRFTYLVFAFLTFAIFYTNNITFKNYSVEDFNFFENLIFYIFIGSSIYYYPLFIESYQNKGIIPDWHLKISTYDILQIFFIIIISILLFYFNSIILSILPLCLLSKYFFIISKK